MSTTYISVYLFLIISFIHCVRLCANLIIDNSYVALTLFTSERVITCNGWSHRLRETPSVPSNIRQRHGQVAVCQNISQ